MLSLLLFSAAVAYAQGTYSGCYSDVTGALTLNQSYIYNTNGYCYNVCSSGGFASYATSQGSQCWCGDALPDVSMNSSSSNCNTKCLAWTDDCGGTGYWSVYLTGTGKLESVSDSPSSAASTGSVSSVTASAASGTSTVVPVTTITAGGSTVLVTPTPTADASTSSSSSSSSAAPSSSSKLSTGAVAGIAVAVVVIVAAAGVVGFFLWRRRQAREEEYTRADDYTSSFQGPAPVEKRVDQRLEPVMLDKRISAASLADEQDYSRKILRVINPDS
jgi:cell wall integrity and stress response component